MAATNDAAYQSIEVTLIRSKSAGCGSPAFDAWFDQGNFRINLPRTTTTSGNVFASELDNNLTRIDPSGGIFTAGIKRYIVPEIVVSISEEEGPGVEKIVNIPMQSSGISDLANAAFFPRITINPLEAAVATSAVTVNGTNLQVRFTRMKTGLSSPFDPVTISVRGIVYEFPQPEPAA